MCPNINILCLTLYIANMYTSIYTQTTHYQVLIIDECTFDRTWTIINDYF